MFLFLILFAVVDRESHFTFSFYMILESILSILISFFAEESLSVSFFSLRQKCLMFLFPCFSLHPTTSL